MEGDLEAAGAERLHQRGVGIERREGAAGDRADALPEGDVPAHRREGPSRGAGPASLQPRRRRG